MPWKMLLCWTMKPSSLKGERFMWFEIKVWIMKQSKCLHFSCPIRVGRQHEALTCFPICKQWYHSKDKVIQVTMLQNASDVKECLFLCTQIPQFSLEPRKDRPNIESWITVQRKRGDNERQYYSSHWKWLGNNLWTFVSFTNVRM